MNQWDLMYRYDAFFTGGGRDEDGCLSFRQCHLIQTVYRIVKRTPKGVWVLEGENKDKIVSSSEKRFVLLGARRKLCHERKADAIIAFMARKRKQISILNSQIADCSMALMDAECEFKKVKES